MFIQNISMKDVIECWHYDPGNNSVLIQICDPDVPFPEANYNFALTKQFSFLDSEEEHPDSIQEQQAQDIAECLRYAKEKRMNAIVHCHAGVCRSGAVVQCAIDFGFEDTGTFRIPNVRVKKMLSKAPGIGFDYENT